MKNNTWVYFFIIALILNLVGILVPNEALQTISKPLIVVFLIVYFIIATSEVKSPIKIWALLALLFSWIGDVLLMFQGKDSIYFLLGLSAFLLAHICYVFFFNRIRTFELIAARWWLLLIVVVYYGLLITFLSPYLADMKLPVRVYGVVISIMFMLAMHMLYLKNREAGLLMTTGALLFIISDSVLAINKFYQSFEPAGFIIMLTYGMAQLLIIEGGIRYLTSASKQ
jgi:uncharacterized membrane protein YhhN